MAAPHESIVLDYARDTVDSPDACLDTQAAARRYLADLRNPMWNFRTGMAETIIEIIESLFCHQQGEDLLGRPLRGKPLILEPFQLFVIYNVCGFFYPGTDLRRFQEVLAMLARKNGKTPFATSFCWAVGLWYARSFSKIKTVSGSMKQNMEGFGFLRYNLRRLGLTMDIDPAHGLRMLDSSLGHSFEGPIWDGQISFEALAYKPDVFDAFNANVVLLDELELYKNAIPYGRLKDATKAYGNKLIMAVTTAGDDGTGFCAQRVSYCSKIARGEITGADADRIFAFIARADPDPDTDEVNYLDPANWRKANPNWGVTIRPSDMEASALLLRAGAAGLLRPAKRRAVYVRQLQAFNVRGQRFCLPAPAQGQAVGLIIGVAMANNKYAHAVSSWNACQSFGCSVRAGAARSSSASVSMRPTASCGPSMPSSLQAVSAKSTSDVRS